MRFRPQYALIALLALTLVACGERRVKRVSEPAAAIQQLTVGSDGSWDVELRLRNYSSMPMRFDEVSLAMKVGDESAGTLRATPGLSIGISTCDCCACRCASGLVLPITIAILQRGSPRPEDHHLRPLIT